tara:strand:+ start:399 stop:1619 length:1221 start_codon:yes stop_codon:yes gene_type:complete
MATYRDSRGNPVSPARLSPSKGQNQSDRVTRDRERPQQEPSRRPFVRPRPNPITPRAITSIYSEFGPDDIVENLDSDVVTAALFSENTGEISGMFTSSAQSQSSGEYYLDVYQKDPSTNNNQEIQFAIAYGHFKGSGSAVPQYASVGFSPSRAVYKQYANTLLNAGDEQFTVTSVHPSSSANLEQFYAINFQRTRMKEKIDPGNWELHVSGNTTPIKLIDDSTVSDGTVTEAGRQYFIRSGTIDAGLFSGDTYHYGVVYPDMGVLILDTAAIDGQVGLTVDSSSYAYSSTAVTVSNANTTHFFHHLSGSSTAQVGYFAARNKETIHSTHYFVRVKNNEFNFSNNPTFTSGSAGTFANASFFRDPKSYITTIGLYNDNNELLAVAKLSKPLLKTFSREALVRVKLEF